MSKSSPACRFYFYDRDSGTRSSVWKVWTGRRGEDVYVAPRRFAGQFKLSIHRDGINQIGYYSKQVRAQIRAADKHYFDRRTRDHVPYYLPGWTLLCTLVFNAREFESVSLEADGKPVTMLNAPPAESDAYVAIIATNDRVNAAAIDTPIAGELPRGERGAIVLTGGSVAHDPSILAAVDTDRSGFGWQPPGAKRSDEPYGFVYGLSGSPRFAEYSSRKHSPPPLVPHLPDLNAKVRPWAEAPAPWGTMDAFCAVLACSSDAATLYVDPRAHCSQHHLVADANDLITAYRTGKLDDQWAALPDGRTVTAITMGATAEAAGLRGYLPNPLKS